MRLTRDAFEALVQRAIRRIPPEFRRHLREVPILVRNRASDTLLREMGVTREDEPLGYYEGTPLTERSVTDSLRYPDTIYLFQRPLEQMCETTRELEEEVEITVRHELGHYLGMDEEALEELGYD